jgi:predicted RNase H-like HicB family nuclease
MEFPIAIHKDEGSVYGVIVPDIAGCHSWGNTFEDAIRNTKRAIEIYVSTLIEHGKEVDISTSTIESLHRQEKYADATWALVDIDLAKFDTQPERVNISLPRFVLRKIDSFADRRRETRSGFLARVALDAIRQEDEAASN